MKLTILFFIAALGFATFADAFGDCYHFYNCTGERFPGGYVTSSQCTGMGGLSIEEGSYCENLSANSQPQWIGECFDGFGCVGPDIGEMTDTECKSMGGNSLLVGSYCDDL